MTDIEFRWLAAAALFQLALNGLCFFVISGEVKAVREMVRDLRWKLFPEEKAAYEEWSRDTDEVFGK